MNKNIMTKFVCMACVFAFVVSFSAKSFAQEEGVGRTGLFMGAGGIVGYEVNQLKRIGGGVASKMGYRFLDTMSVYLESDVYFTSKWGTNFIIVTAVPTFSYDIFMDLYGYVGFGYELMHASAGANFGGVNYNITKNWNGWTGESGLGYNFWIGRTSISPEIGFNYSRVASSNFYTPCARVVASYHW